MIACAKYGELRDYYHLAEETKESLFYLSMPLEHIDFHVIDYWTSSIYGHCDIFL